MASPGRFFILSENVPASHIPSFMCRVVADPLLPQQKYAPFPPIHGNEAYRGTNNIIPSITPPPQISMDCREFLQRVKKMGFLVSLTSFFGIDLESGNQDTLELNSAVIKRYTLSNPESYFEELLQDELYDQALRNLLESSAGGKAFLVTGFITATGAVWKKTTGQSQVTSLVATAPISAIGGVPALGLDPSFSPSRTTEYNKERELRVVEEEIFAVAYSEVRFSRSFDKTAPKFIKKLPVVGPPKRAKARHLAMGIDSDEEIEVSSDEEDGPNKNQDGDRRLALVNEDLDTKLIERTFIFL
jgi:hypothetical protein